VCLLGVELRGWLLLIMLLLEGYYILFNYILVLGWVMLGWVMVEYVVESCDYC